MNNKIATLIGIGSFIIGATASAGIAKFLWDIKENQQLEKEINHLMDLKKEIESFGDPKDDDVDNFTSKHLDGIAYQLELNHRDGYGIFSRKCAAKVIRKMAGCLQDDEIIADFANRTRYDGIKLM